MRTVKPSGRVLVKGQVRGRLWRCPRFVLVSGSAPTGACFYGAGYFGLHGTPQHGREIVVQPLADRRLHALDNDVGLFVKPSLQDRIERLAYGAIENRFNRATIDGRNRMRRALRLIRTEIESRKRVIDSALRLLGDET